MKMSGNRPQRIALDQLDSAVDEALMRVAQIEELSAEELNQVSGGSVLGSVLPTAEPGTDPTTTTGFAPTDTSVQAN